MTEMAPESPAGSCRPNGRNKPRTLRSRHLDDCPGDCAGCQPCTRDHCRICRHTHANGACGECLTDVREHLDQIGRMCGDLEHTGGTTNPLLTETSQTGLDSEAMYLLGPVANPTAWQQRGTYGHRYHPDALLGDHHPAWVLATWETRVRAELGHDKATTIHIGRAIDYLGRNLTYLAGYQDLPFEDMADELRQCRRNLEAVLHDGEQVDQGAPCMKCHARLERTWGDKAKDDGWTCPRCKQTSTDHQYRFAVMHLHREEAEWLTDRDMEIRTGVKAGTVRVWANRGLVARRKDSGRTVYSVPDVRARSVGDEVG